jgi:prephenate dehydratase
VRVAYLGPPGTFSEEAVRRSGLGGDSFEPMPCDSIPEAIEAVAEGRADRAMLPFENSIEGSVRPTMDSLLEQAGSVTVIGEYRLSIREALIARDEIELGAITEVISHPQPLAQCARFIRERLPGAAVSVATSTSAAVQEVADGGPGQAAIAPASAAPIYGCVVLEEGIEDEAGNQTRFLSIAPVGSPPEPADGGSGTWKTTLVFSELGADHPGALVEALVEFSDREINLVRIESRPQKRELGRYLFFIDVEGRADDQTVSEALDGLRSKAGEVKVLGTYPAAG